MKNGKKRLYRSKVFWGVLLAAWVVLTVFCVLGSMGVLADRETPALLYVACGLGIFTSVVQLWKVK